MGLFSNLKENRHFPEMPPQDLGRVDKFNSSSIIVVYTPISNITQQIMNKTALAPFLKGRCTDGKKRITDIILYLFDKMYTCLIGSYSDPLC